MIQCAIHMLGIRKGVENGKSKGKNKENTDKKIDTTGKLRELKKMLDEKIITEKEYEDKKQEILKKM